MCTLQIHAENTCKKKKKKKKKKNTHTQENCVSYSVHIFSRRHVSNEHQQLMFRCGVMTE